MRKNTYKLGKYECQTGVSGRGIIVSRQVAQNFIYGELYPEQIRVRAGLVKS